MFDKSEGREPLEFTAGTGEIIPRARPGVCSEWRSANRREVTVPPEEAYGDRDEARVQSVPREAIPEHIPTDPGTHRSACRPRKARPCLSWCRTSPRAMSSSTANHPLAGKTLTFDVTLVEID